MRIAVASQNFRTITGHAGMTRRFMVFDAAPCRPCVEVEQIELAKDQTIHAFGDGPHPLDSVQVVIAGSAGAGFVSKMAARGVAAIITDETDPATAVTNYLAGRLQTAAPQPHDHNHDHDHHNDDKDGCCGNCTCA